VRDTVLCLCDYTGNFARPWVEAGYRAILVDPQHDGSRFAPESGFAKLGLTVDESLDMLPRHISSERIAFVAAFPPCTDLAVSGARWFETKRQADPLFQAKAVALAEQCRTIGRLSGAPWFVENPVSVLSSVWGRPDHYFDPCDYTGYELDDNYTKRTCLWTGGGFVMPKPERHPFAGTPDDRIHKAPPSPERANFRSATPMGFARAVFAANGRKAVAA
jgi:hypothetical protein